MTEKTKKTSHIKGIQRRKGNELIYSSTQNSEDKNPFLINIILIIIFLLCFVIGLYYKSFILSSIGVIGSILFCLIKVELKRKND